MCPLIRQGIVPAPVEWARSAGRDEPVSTRELDMEDTFRRMQCHLPYGSTALARVIPTENGGRDIVPVIIARRSPCPWDRTFSSDKMFAPGDIMVWIHEIKPVKKDREDPRFQLSSETVSNDNMRAVPLVTIAALGMPMSAYMTQSTIDPSVWKTKTSAIKDARSNAVLMSLNPSEAFVNHAEVALDVSDTLRAPVLAHGKYPEGTLLPRKVRAPTVYIEGQRRATRAWKGAKEFTGEIVGQQFDAKSRRYSYKVNWSGGTPGDIALAGLEGVIDEGAVELILEDYR